MKENKPNHIGIVLSPDTIGMKGLKLPTRNNCPECSEQYWEFRQSQANRRSIHARDEYHHNMDRRLKNRSVHGRLRKRVVDQNWVDYEEEVNEEEYVW